MKANYHTSRVLTLLSLAIALVAGLLAGPLGALAAIALSGASLLIDPRSLTRLGTGSPYPAISGSSVSQITGLSSHGQEVLYEHEVLMSAAQANPFSDNMTGAFGSGKPIIMRNDTTKVAGTTITIPTVDPFGAPVVQGNAVRVGQEEQVKPGDFQLTVNIGWFGAGIDNTGRTQTIIGLEWDEITKEGLANRLAKQQSDDGMMNLKCAAASANTIFPNGKTVDTLGTADTYSQSLVVKSGGILRDIGARPINARPIRDENYNRSLRINRYLQFTTDANGRPIKTDSAYLHALQWARERAETNPLFEGDYVDVDNNILYPFQTIRHGGYGSIGCALQPEALLGTTILPRGTSGGQSNTLPTAATLDGGGSSAAATVTPPRNYFEFWSLYNYTPINGVAQTYSPHGSAIAYGAIQNPTTGHIGFFSYTGNTGNTLTGVVFAGGATAGDYSSAAIGNVTYGTAPWTTTPDGAGFAGISDGGFPSGSKMWEVNSKGVPLAFGFGLGEMALVCGYGRVPLANGGFKTKANRTFYQAPHGQAYANGIEVCYGTAAYKRPDGLTPNFVLNVFARALPGFPVIT